MMLRGYGDAIMATNPGLSEALLARCLTRWWDVRDDEGPERIAAFRYPEPDEAHPVGSGAQTRKIRQAQAEASVPVYAFSHGYGPDEDVAARMAVAWEASGRRMWVNRYGYLSDAKLDALGRLPR
jgi:predicted dienelactone hydrolase